ncbi:DNA-processing protein DprA [Amnibacterium sp. CER49]|uniref:DNA-processing protein DprA n=1 Tax=Amnibacterium sp. CER49 TaxID=3039161 RepID=UPI00244873AF|nr:DNA-processing protein DprA [Amnibacterium sp. CER49]MDH2442731.1 DNA-processing protein DprA [Amnibacterium sp. CER49]
MSRLLGIDREAVRAAAAGVRRGEELDDDAAAEVFARGAWTGLVEPGDRVAGALVTAYGAAAALDATRTGALPALPEVAAATDRWAPRLEAQLALRAFRNAAHLGARLVLPGDADWPDRLGDLGHHTPIALWCLGAPERLTAVQRSIALVGARASSGYGERLATEASAGLADRGFAIVSGAAYGIDGVAHRAALASGGTTIAVLAGGLDRFYPAGHVQLLTRIAREGAVVAELPPGFAPTRWRFLQRNRVIAALAQATVVIEAGARSGSLNTAAHAGSIGRPVGAAPGSVFSATSAGCHRLLREFGAVCVRDAADMAELVTGPGEQVPLEGLHLDRAGDPTEQRVLDALTGRPRPVVEIARGSGLSVADALGALGMLQLTGAARETTGGWARGRA